MTCFLLIKREKLNTELEIIFAYHMNYSALHWKAKMARDLKSLYINTTVLV